MEQLELVMTEDDDDDIKTPELLVGRPQTLEEATNMFTGLDQIEKQSYIAKGYILRVVKDDCLYQEAGYLDIYDYAIRMGLAKHRGTVDKLMKINERFSMTGYSPFVADEYKMYNNSALQELYKMTDEEIEAAGITETMTVVKIREAKKEMMGEEPEIPEQIPGQMEITDIIAPTEDNNLVATSQPEELSQDDRELIIFSRFLTDIYERYMTEKQHRFIEDKNETAFIQHTIEILLPLFERKQDTASIYTNCRFAVEISPDGYIKIQDGETTVIRHWKDAVKRIQVLKVLGDFPDHYDTDEIFRYLPEQQGKVDCSSHIITREMAKAAVDELKINHIEIPLEIDGIIKMVRDYYEPSYIAFRCGYNAYMAEIDGAGEVLTVHRLNSKTGSQEVRDIFEISIDELAQDIDELAQEIVINSTAQSHLEENKDEIDFKVSIERLKEEYEQYKNKQNVINTSAETDSETAADGDNLPSPTEEIVEAEVITQPGRQTLPPAAGAEETVINDIQYNGCAGQDKDGENYTCPPRRKPCDTECKWKPTGQTFGEKQAICTECWETYVKDLIEKDRNEEITPAAGETTVIVNHDTIAEQKELPKLKNNDQRRTWIENFEEWPLWIDNKETQERFYRYIFENGDIFVIRQAYSQRLCWDYEERKSTKKPRWTYEKEYIVRKDSEMTLSDSETNRTAMIEYLKNLQKK